MKSYNSKFCNDHYMTVLDSLTKSPKSAQEISLETNVTLSTVYRQLKLFKENKLVQISGVIRIAKNGKICRIRLYKKSSSLEELSAIGN